MMAPWRYWLDHWTVPFCRVRARYDDQTHDFKYDRPWWYLGKHHTYENMVVYRRSATPEEAWLKAWQLFSDCWLFKWYCPCGYMNREDARGCPGEMVLL